jgi:hypothetical protein
MFHKEIFFQIDTEVVKNLIRDDYINGLLTENKLSFEGGAGICLHFQSCDCNFNIELKFASILIEAKQFHVWGTCKLGQ